MELTQLFDLCVNEKRIVSLVGAGGKTTLMYSLAQYAAGIGKKVVVMTTTHIILPEQGYAIDYPAVKDLWEQGTYAVIGEKDPQNHEKLVSPSEAMLNQVKLEADLILIEADGAKRHPCKLPANHEPVICEDCDLVIGVMGMSALGQSLKQCCFRFVEEGSWLNVSGDSVLDERIAARILSSNGGTKKSVGDRDYVVVLNQCDDEVARAKAMTIANVLVKDYQIQTVCAKLKG